MIRKLVRLSGPRFATSSYFQEREMPDSETQWVPTPANGFLPRQTPLLELPEKFKALENLLTRMPIQKLDKSPGLLANGTFGDALLKELPVIDVSDVNDTRTLEALHRDYGHLASAFLFEPVDLEFRQTGKHGLARDYLPPSIAVPFDQVARKLGVRPYLEYSKQVLINWVLRDPKVGIVAENIWSPRNFEGTPGEMWFKAIHVEMTGHSPQMVRHFQTIFDAVDRQDREAFNEGLAGLSEVIDRLNTSIQKMWKGLHPSNFKGFRNFLMGSSNKTVQLNGVVYKGVSDEPRHFEGPAGTGDLMMPSLETVLGIFDIFGPGPEKKFLATIREHRPPQNEQFFRLLTEITKEKRPVEFAVADNSSLFFYYSCLVKMAVYRDRHWALIRGYLMRSTSLESIFGSYDSLSWVPRRLKTLLDRAEDIDKAIDVSKLKPDQVNVHERLRKRVAGMQKQVNEDLGSGKPASG